MAFSGVPYRPAGVPLAVSDTCRPILLKLSGVRVRAGGKGYRAKYPITF